MWPSEVCLQGPASNHLKRHGSRAPVVSVREKAPVRRQVGTEKANASEPSFKCRKHSDDIETGE